jgi:nitrate/nitrite transporter NarK
MPVQSLSADSASPASRPAWAMLAALCSAFMLSHAYRTAAAMMAGRMQAEFSLSPQQLGSYAGAFHFAFGAMQLFVGLAIDLHGVRRTMLVTFPLAVAGALLSALAHSYTLVVLGQVLIGIGCSAAFLVCTVFITRYFAPERFASVSGMVLGIGGGGMLLTATPLAWVVQEVSWRAGFLVLAGLSTLAWLLIFIVVRESPQQQPRHRESLGAAVRGMARLMALPYTIGIMALGAVTYAAFMSLRGLWLGPLLVERYGYTLVESGNVALLVSVVSIMGLAPTAGAVLACSLLVGFLSGFIVLQYADVRASYPVAQTGRAMSLLNMAMFLGVALVQWLSGAVASMASASRWHADTYSAALGLIAATLVVGIVAFISLPAPD